jgi:hypothetical protein
MDALQQAARRQGETGALLSSAFRPLYEGLAGPVAGFGRVAEANGGAVRRLAEAAAAVERWSRPAGQVGPAAGTFDRLPPAPPCLVARARAAGLVGFSLGDGFAGDGDGDGVVTEETEKAGGR